MEVVILPLLLLPTECMVEAKLLRIESSHPHLPLEHHLHLLHLLLLLGMDTGTQCLLAGLLLMTLSQNTPSIRWMNFLLQRIIDLSRKSTLANRSEELVVLLPCLPSQGETMSPVCCLDCLPQPTLIACLLTPYREGSLSHENICEQNGSGNSPPPSYLSMHSTSLPRAQPPSLLAREWGYCMVSAPGCKLVTASSTAFHLLHIRINRSSIFRMP